MPQKPGVRVVGQVVPARCATGPATFLGGGISGACAAAPAAPRPSAYRRGYTHHWRKLRQSYLLAHPLCRHCHASG